MTFVMKNRLAARPMPATTKEIMRYYQRRSDMNLKIRTPMPRTRKFEMNVKVFLRLLSLS